ncbi:AAA-12 domain-containing protein [Mycena indigotica]|uniref:AAA-12 domain-containing protein n=1 Tax=Mycena indigotica TaxID=2126181 RepID=A0A8H6TF21_9AGAR|nr:AAA-12 domain-containing protein [Mycena indigotica]KAF7315521.1 AAA-12 domain-containing protein [Mycena indigotica]
MKLSATNLSKYHFNSCDLYLHNTYHGNGHDSPVGHSESTQAHFQRGIDWERACLMPYLDAQDLLLTIPPRPIDGGILVEHIKADSREHFFMAGVEFLPPMVDFRGRFWEEKNDPVTFGLAKPDLIEIMRIGEHIVWRVVDAKAAKAVKTSHHVQVYFYHLCLSFLLPSPLFKPAEDAAIWLPPANGFDAQTRPSMADLHSIKISLLAQSLDKFLFRNLPKIVFRPREEIQWHFNPLCRDCPFEANCKQLTIVEGRFGTIPNISPDQVEVLRGIVRKSQVDNQHRTTDIEDLHHLLSNNEMRRLDPIAAKKAKRILAMRKSSLTSPILEAAKSHTVTVIPRRNVTLPRHEDVSVVISVVIDPSTSKQTIAFFCISVFSSIPAIACKSVSGLESAFIENLASLLKEILAVEPAPLTQIYVFSSSEEDVIRAYLIKAALTASSVSENNLRLCLGAIVEGAALLETNFQPSIISQVANILRFNQNQFPRPMLESLAKRMNLPGTGTMMEIRSQIQAKLKTQTPASDIDDRRTEMGQLPCVVVLKKEIEGLLALPVPGYWDLSDCAQALLPPESDDRVCPTEQDIFATYRRDAKPDTLRERLEQRNASIHAVLRETRRRVSNSQGAATFVNLAKPLRTNFLDICYEPNLRKLFFMQQFEVLAKLSEMWKSRIDGCPDAPVLEYKIEDSNTENHVFYLISGNIDASGSKNQLFDYVLAEDDNGSIPPETFFDDLSLLGCRFPIDNSDIKAEQWDTQNPIVIEKLCIAGVHDIRVLLGRTRVVLKLWGQSNTLLKGGAHYRLSPRLVDFNTKKVLSTLLELDIKLTINPTDISFLQLIVDPRTFANDAEFHQRGQQLARIEATIQNNLSMLSNSHGPEHQSSALVLKASQHRAVQRMLSNRLSVLWGPPGTGKTHTIALALLRLLQSYHRLGDRRQRIVFITAMTHAAINAIDKKLKHLMACYKSIDAYPVEWLNHVQLERVSRGYDHAPPPANSTSMFYLGTIYQLYAFSTRSSFQVDMCVIDEAGQLALSSAALILRNLGPQGRIVAAGDSHQLAPILKGVYPNHFLFGSVLDCLMQSSDLLANSSSDMGVSDSALESDSEGPVVQLTENFRLNPDLGRFIETIYPRAFKPQKLQSAQLGALLSTLENDIDDDTNQSKFEVMRNVRKYLLDLALVMKGGTPPATLKVPRVLDPGNATARAISLALIRLQGTTRYAAGIGYEAHVRGEAVLAAALVTSLQRCCPDEDIFVAVPYRIQRQLVMKALKGRVKSHGEQVEGVVVDTVERLQGSEAGFVICLFSLPSSAASKLPFLLERRRLNVAISRAKTLCIFVSSSTVLEPPVHVLANEGTAKAYEFLQEFEHRAWSSTIKVNVDGLH